MDMDTSVLADHRKLAIINSVQTLDTIHRTYQGRWLIGTDDKRESSEFMLSAHLHAAAAADDDDDDEPNSNLG